MHRSIVESGTPDVSESKIQYYEIRKATTTSRWCSKLQRTNGPTRRNRAGSRSNGIQIAFDHRTYKFMLIYATTITHCQIRHSRCAKDLFKTLRRFSRQLHSDSRTFDAPTVQPEQRHSVYRIDIVKYGSFGGHTY